MRKNPKRTLALIGITVLAITRLGIPSTASAAGATGQAIYEKSCASCHGKDGSGDTVIGKKKKLRDLRSAEVQKQTDDELFKAIAQGSQHPMAKKMSEADIKAIVSYLRELAKAK